MFETVTTTVTDAVGGVLLGAGANESGVLVVNKHATDSIWLHGAARVAADRVAAAPGFQLKPGESMDVMLSGRADKVYAVAAAGKSVPVDLARS